MEGFCRGCLVRYDDPMEMVQYSEKYRRLFVYSTGLQVKRNDTITFQLCKDCFLSMKSSCKFKKLCRGSDKKLKSYLTLKDVDNRLDFCTFLRNSDDTMAFRLPLMSGSSTPVHQNKSRDEDNDSTCTSIRNFMTDILQGEEMPDTEARIIREVIEEEADVFDESLDSHWLEDDVSIDTDFRLDFSISPFATPHSINNDHCYTPKRFGDPKEEHLKKYFTSISPARQHRHVNDFTDMIRNNKSEKELCILGTEETNNEKELCVLNTEEINNEIPPGNNFDIPIIENGNTVQHLDLLNINNNKTINNLDLSVINNEKSLNVNLAIIDGDKSVTNLDFSIIDNEKSINNLHLPMIEEERSANNLDYPIIDSDNSINNLDFPIIDHEKSINNQNLPVIEVEKSLNNLDLSSLPSIDTERSMNNLDLSLNGNEKYINTLNLSFDSEKSLNNLDIQSLPSIDNERSTNNLDLPMVDYDDGNYDQRINTPNFYVPTDGTAYITASKEIERIIDAKKLEKDKPCTIDKNLEKALENEENKEFSLDDLLVSPQVYHEASGASTPTIANILFGEKVNINITGSNISPEYIEKKYKVDTLKFEKFLQDDPKELHMDDTENKIADIKDVFKVPMDVDEVDTGTKRTIQKQELSTKFDEAQFDLETFFCNICDKKFDSYKAIYMHALNKHKVKIRKPKCVSDEVDTGTKQTIKKHELSTEFDETQVDLETFPCNICDKKFKSYKAIYMHAINKHKIKISNSKRVSYVVDTEIKTINEDELSTEFDETQFDLETFLCRICDKKFESYKAIYMHAINKHQIKIRKVKGVSEEVDTGIKETIKKLKLSTQFDENQFDLETFLCRICDKKFESTKAINIHAINKHRIKIRKPKGFRVSMDVDQVDTGSKETIKEFRLSTEFDEKHFDLETFLCKICDIKFGTSKALSLHVIKKHKIKLRKPKCFKGLKVNTEKLKLSTEFKEELFDLKSFFCKSCDKKFDSSKAISIHAVKTHNIKIIKPKSFAYKYNPRICSFCGQLYRDLQAYHRHIKIHKKSQPEEGVFQCNYCNIEFTLKSKLEKHIRSHNGMSVNKRPGKYVCTVCGATSTTISNFKLHQRRHTNNFKHKCDECNKGFFRLSDLTCHMRRHTGERPFPCIYCESTFARKDALTKHVKIHIDDKPYECEHCVARYAIKSQLIRHMKDSKLCKRKRGIMVDTMVVKDKKDKTKTVSAEILDDPMEEANEVEEVNDANEDNVVISSQLPYIDTEMSN